MRLLCLFYLTWHSVIKPKKLPKKKRKRRKPVKSILMLNSTTAQSVKRFCTSELPKSCGINRVICKMNWIDKWIFGSPLLYFIFWTLSNSQHHKNGKKIWYIKFLVSNEVQQINRFRFSNPLVSISNCDGKVVPFANCVQDGLKIFTINMGGIFLKRGVEGYGTSKPKGIWKRR